MNPERVLWTKQSGTDHGLSKGTGEFNSQNRGLSLIVPDC